jgi:saccharopine dehydrogenase (NAD+, L-glutamate forming)
MADREYDVVLLGATGFTGGLTAQYLARNAGDARVALAGRSMSKLEAVRDRIGADLPLVQADVGDAASLRALAASTKVLATTVGPYALYGEPVVAACAAEGTDYCDLTGEPEFADRMYVLHHETAVRTGARLVHACGFDSIPHDLGALYCVQQLPEGVPLTVKGYVRAGGRPAGGTF